MARPLLRSCAGLSRQPGTRGGLGQGQGGAGGRGGRAKRRGKVPGKGSTPAGSCWWSLKLEGRQDGSFRATRSSPQANPMPRRAGKSNRYAFP